MTDRHGEAKPEEQPGVDDAAQAFEALRQTVEDLAGDLTREMTTIRKGVETAFEQIETYQKPVDYGTELSRMSGHLAKVGERLQGVEQSPLLKHGPQQHAQALAQAGEHLVKNAAQQLETASRDLQRSARVLAAHVERARARHVQNWWLLGAGAGGLVLGILLTLFLPSVLPFSVAERTASTVMAQPPWQVGARLMEFANPQSWNRIAAADQLIKANEAEVTACREVAAKAKKDQKCSINVKAAP